MAPNRSIKRSNVSLIPAIFGFFEKLIISDLVRGSRITRCGNLCMRYKDTS